MTQDTRSPLSFANPGALPCYFCFNGFCFEWAVAVSSSLLSPQTWPWAQRARPALPVPAPHGRAGFPLAVKNELFLMDFWLAFSRHLAHS